MAFHFAKTIEYCLSHCHPTPDHCCDSTSKCLIFCPSTCLYPLLTTPAPPNPPHHHNPYSSLVIPIVIAAFASLVICLFAIYLNINRRRRRAMARGSVEAELDVVEDRGLVVEVDHPIWYIRTLGLQPSVISAITVFKYRKNDGFVDVSDCAICLTEFHEGDTLRLLHKCNHAFHTPCIDTWLRSHTNCPMCRALIVAPQPMTPSEEEEGYSFESRRREVRVRITEELGRGIEGNDLGFRRGEETQLGFRNRSGGFKEDGDACLEIDAMRRSVSMDCCAANNLKTGESNMELSSVMSSGVGGGSRGRYLQSSGATTSLKRSLSCGAKLFLSRYAPN